MTPTTRDKAREPKVPRGDGDDADDNRSTGDFGKGSYEGSLSGDGQSGRKAPDGGGRSAA